MVKHSKTIAIAESVTSGQVIAMCSLAKDATKFFQGGITADNLGQKIKQLSVDPIHAEQMNCVSEVVVESMAREVSRLFCSHWGIHEIPLTL